MCLLEKYSLLFPIRLSFFFFFLHEIFFKYILQSTGKKNPSGGTDACCSTEMKLPGLLH